MPDFAYGDNPLTTPAASQAAMPQDTQAETAVLSAMMRSEDVLAECLSGLVTEQDFYIPSNRLIFKSMAELNEKGLPVDQVSLADYLKSQGNLEKVGGWPRLVDLGSDMLSLGSWSHHVDILRRDATLREIIAASARISALAYDAPEDTKEVVEGAEKLIFNVTERELATKYQTMEQIAEKLYETLSEMSESNTDIFGVQTGFPEIDRNLLGLRPGQVMVIGARPGIGKTAFALNLAVNAAMAGASVAFFSLEMSAEEIGQRLLAARANIDLNAIRAADIKSFQWPDLLAATNQLRELDIMVDDTPGTTVTEIRAKARRMLRDKPKGLVIIDYLQLISPAPSSRRADSRATEVSEMSRGIKILAKDFQIPVVALSQLNRDQEKRTGKFARRPQLSDLRESGSIEQDADIVLLLDRSTSDEEAASEGRPDKNVVEVHIAKNRSGPPGTARFIFNGKRMTYTPLDSFHGEE